MFGDGRERGEFEAFRRRVKGAVDARLAELLEARVASVPGGAADLAAVVDAVRALAVRGGKRLRAVLVAAAYEGCGGAGGADTVVMAGVALELLQTYLLIHDDVMDGDDTRRGGPSVHAALAARFGSARAGETAAVLAGDLASALAQSALLAVPVAASRLVEASRELARMQEDVVHGQLLDVLATEEELPDLRAVEAMHALKTGSYTVRGPLLVGALLAGAPSKTCERLARFAAPLGVAFQLRDDLLGTFGDAAATGKPAGSDLRQGKRTALVVELAGDAAAQELIPRVLGVPGARAEDVQALVERIVSTGAKERVESRLAALTREATAELEGIELAPLGRSVLRGAIDALSVRVA